MSEAEAITGAKQGDARCFEALYHLHRACVYSLCLSMAGAAEAAEDLTQEVFLQLYDKIPGYRGEPSFSAWLHRLAINTVLAQRRKNGPQCEPCKVYGFDDPHLAGSIDRLNLQRAVASLPPGYRKVFLLHDVEGYEHNEIAGIMRCSVGNSKSQLHNARLKLRGLLNAA